jgi:hypothetical protein
VASAKPSKAEPDEPQPGTLVVTSIPSGLIVEVDGRRVDFTPARVKVDSGFHTVALFKGDQRLYERKVDVPEEGVSAVDADVSEKLKPPPVAEAAPVEKAPQALPGTSLSEELPEPDAAVEPQAARAKGGPRGELHVVSLNVYGEVWINGQAYGYPPLLAKNLPAGTANVEIRVNGVARRSKSVDIEGGRRAVVRIR